MGSVSDTELEAEKDGPVKKNSITNTIQVDTNVAATHYSEEKESGQGERERQLMQQLEELYAMQKNSENKIDMETGESLSSGSIAPAKPKPSPKPIVGTVSAITNLPKKPVSYSKSIMPTLPEFKRKLPSVATVSVTTPLPRLGRLGNTASLEAVKKPFKQAQPLL